MIQESVGCFSIIKEKCIYEKEKEKVNMEKLAQKKFTGHLVNVT